MYYIHFPNIHTCYTYVSKHNHLQVGCHSSDWFSKANCEWYSRFISWKDESWPHKHFCWLVDKLDNYFASSLFYINTKMIIIKFIKVAYFWCLMLVWFQVAQANLPQKAFNRLEKERLEKVFNRTCIANLFQKI